MLYTDMANMLIMPGRATTKNSRHGFMEAYISSVFIFIVFRPWEQRAPFSSGEHSTAFCFLIYSNKITQMGIERMKVLRQNTDGFFIANQDLKLRGPGEITGTLQAGNLTLGIADVVRDNEILKIARTDAFTFMKHKIQGV